MTDSLLLLIQTGTSCSAFPNLCLSFHTDYIPHQLKYLLDCFQISKIWLYLFGSSIFYIFYIMRVRQSRKYTTPFLCCSNVKKQVIVWEEELQAPSFAHLTNFLLGAYTTACVSSSLIKGKVMTIPACRVPTLSSQISGYLDSRDRKAEGVGDRQNLRL